MLRPYKHHLRIPSKWEAAIRSGHKTIDARVQGPETDGVVVGDVLRYNSLKVRVRHIRRYASFNDLLAYEDYSRVVPGADSEEEALVQLRGDHSVEERAMGVEAIEFELMEGAWI